MKNSLAQISMLILFGLGYAAMVTAPAVLIMPFLLTLRANDPVHAVKKCFAAIGAGVATVLLGSVPMMNLLFMLIGPGLNNLDNSSGALDGTGLAFAIFSLGGGVTLASLVALWIEWVILK